MHHKRRRPKNRRAGCLLCKSHKQNCGKNGDNSQRRQELKARISEKEQKSESGQ